MLILYTELTVQTLRQTSNTDQQAIHLRPHSSQDKMIAFTIPHAQHSHARTTATHRLLWCTFSVSRRWPRAREYYTYLKVYLALLLYSALANTGNSRPCSTLVQRLATGTPLMSNEPHREMRPPRNPRLATITNNRAYCTILLLQRRLVSVAVQNTTWPAQNAAYITPAIYTDAVWSMDQIDYLV